MKLPVTAPFQTKLAATGFRKRPVDGFAIALHHPAQKLAMAFPGRTFALTFAHLVSPVIVRTKSELATGTPPTEPAHVAEIV